LLHLVDIVKQFLITVFCFLKSLFELSKTIVVELVKDFHLKSSKSFAPAFKLILNMHFKLFFFSSILIEEFPVILLAAYFSCHRRKFVHQEF
jgi:uncharacterized protein with PQ loop repeat